MFILFIWIFLILGIISENNELSLRSTAHLVKTLFVLFYRSSELNLVLYDLIVLDLECDTEE